MFTVPDAYALDAARLMPELTWEKRVLLVFAPGEQHAGYRRQLGLLDGVDGGLRERDMSVIRVFADDRVTIDGQTHDNSATSFYRRFGVNRDEFRTILIGKDGTVKLDRDRAVTSDDLFALIDAMPMRRYEMLQDN